MKNSIAGEFVVVPVVLIILVVRGVQHVDCVAFCTSRRNERKRKRTKRKKEKRRKRKREREGEE